MGMLCQIAAHLAGRARAGQTGSAMCGGILTDCIAATDQTVIAESWKHHYNGIQRLSESGDDH